MTDDGLPARQRPVTDDGAFLVCTHGWSGSNWLALALDRHPRLACSHNVLYDRRPEADDSDQRVWVSGLHRVIRARNAERFEHAVDAVVARIRGDQPGVRHGNVGYFRARDFPVLAARHGPNRRPVDVVNLVRDPVAVVCSGYGQFRRRFRYDLAEFHWNLGKIVDSAEELVGQVTARFGVVAGQVDTLAFLAAALTLFSLALDAQAVARLTSTPTFRFHGTVRLEDLASRPDAVARLLACLAPGVEADAAYLQQAVDLRPVNVHHEGPALTPAEKYQRLEPWQQHALTWCWQRAAVAGFYAAQGYDLSYLPDPSHGPDR